MLRGADVTLVTGKSSLTPPPFVRIIEIESAKDMYDAVMENAPDADIIVKAAAVADYRPKNPADNKIKKKNDDMSIELERTDDILKTLGENKRENQFICGFSMETENLIENSRVKLEKKNADMIVANNLKTEGAGFGTDTNVVTFITKDAVEEKPIMSKNKAADEILSFIMSKI
jgi:phosphopantothenoylcysteine decarboxylase/phosphopantothenate--cysteine ligase